MARGDESLSNEKLFEVPEQMERLLHELWYTRLDFQAGMDQYCQLITGLDRVPSSDETPPIRYVVATTSRVGGHFLSQLLKGLGAGDPLEYFGSFEHGRLTGGVPMNWSEYIDTLYRHRSVNGVFGVKMSFLNLVPFLVHKSWHGQFADWKWVYLQRDDVLAQAASLVKAEQTGEWSYAGNKDGTYDPPQMWAAVRLLMRDRMRWDLFFSIFGIQALRVTYEEIDRDVVAVANRVRLYLGLNNSHLSLNGIDFMRKQATLQNADWRARLTEQWK